MIPLLKVALFLLFATAQGALPPMLLIHEETRQCMEWDDQPGCRQCRIPSGWKSIGAAFEDTVACPTGYSYAPSLEVEELQSYHCVETRNEYCCSAFYGYVWPHCWPVMVENQQEHKCSLSLCEELPPGWTRSLVEGEEDEYEDYRDLLNTSDYTGYCLGWELWEDQNDDAGWTWLPWDDPTLGGSCQDPCAHYNFSCGECVAMGCTWSPRQASCHVGCEAHDNCIVTTKTEHAEQLCQTITELMDADDEANCHKTSCEGCTHTALNSDPTQHCRWVDQWWGEGESCVASRCLGICREIDDCAESKFCAQETENCTECVQAGCSWGFGQRYPESTSDDAYPACYRGDCRVDLDCVSLDAEAEEEPSLISKQSQDEECVEDEIEICKEILTRYRDREYCHRNSDCATCSQTPLLSNETQHCKWLQPRGSRSGHCVAACPAGDSIICDETIACSRRRSFYRYCDQCLAAGGYWNADPYFAEDAALLGYHSWMRCTEAPCSTPDFCFNDKDDLTGTNWSTGTLEFCLRHDQSVAAEHPWECGKSYPLGSCEACLRDGCSWFQQECLPDYPPENASNTSHACIHALDLIEDEDETPIRPVESSIGNYCRNYRKEVSCPTRHLGTSSPTNETHWEEKNVKEANDSAKRAGGISVLACVVYAWLVL
ncbi:unknown protein [Seminavis robusta]|uniref:Uncharacterized protein n=1 Tax=Seminavis robusta TaxID=568900 RepID=A0A9N8EKE6_9STRA|nr:unknown protein [Seminavis robusta]|eukprot:Sro1143_g246020.1 n/a (660) ;mRNA; r:26876-28921